MFDLFFYLFDIVLHNEFLLFLFLCFFGIFLISIPYIVAKIVFDF